MKSVINISGILFLLIFSFSISSALAHGVTYEIQRDSAVIVKAGYDDGEPMSYAEVKIFSPDVQKVEHQNGRTDNNGNFAFLPNRTGKWRIVVNDGLGHSFTAETLIKEKIEIESHGQGLGNWQKLIMSACIIWGLTGTALYFKRE
ncbi:MAG: hypothetical protein SVR08_09040 [Spirochaetota bacterium]|nr:hypothetical protein [Spirochaetota bacterium]